MGRLELGRRGAQSKGGQSKSANSKRGKGTNKGKGTCWGGVNS